MGILEMDFERILGVTFFISSFHSIMLCSSLATLYRLKTLQATLQYPSLYFESLNHQQYLNRFCFEILNFGRAEVIRLL